MKELMLTSNFAAALTGNLCVRLLAVMICADMVFGALRAVKFRCWNSAVGIDGGIRKAGMLACILLLTLMDMLLPINCIGWLDGAVGETLSGAGITKLGLTELFSLLFFLYEATSVLKNMLLCGIPIPAGIRGALARWLTQMTDETHTDPAALESGT